MRHSPVRFLTRVGALASKEVIHIRRDPRTLYLALVMPVVLLLVFGYGVTFDIDQIPIAVVDLDRTPASRTVARTMLAPGELVAAAEPVDFAHAESLLKRGEVLAVLTLPAGLSRDLARGETVRLPLTVDGADVVVANQVLSKADALARAAGARLAVESGAPVASPLQAKLWTRFNPGLRSALFLVPGLAGYLLAIGAVLLTALTIAGEWERGSMEQLFASPVGRLDILIGKLIPYLGLGLLQFLLVLAVGVWAFDVPIRGPLGPLFAAGMLFLIGMLGQGLLISVVARNQLVATQAGALSSLLPSMLLSGFVIPIENMPWVLQVLSHVIPARYLVHALRGVMLKGAGLADISGDLVALTVFAVAVFALATIKFRRRLA